MKISIISISSSNYGNRLQAYAMHQILNKLGYTDVVSLRVPPEPVKLSFRESVHGFAYRWKRKLIDAFGKKRAAAPSKTVLANRFTEAHIPTVDAQDAKTIAAMPGVMLIGSDQCWNHNWEIGSRLDGAQFAVGVLPNNKMAYAASMGVGINEIPIEWRGRYAEWLKTFNDGSISVREYSTAEALRNLAGIEAPVVLDPTLLLAPSDWASIEVSPYRNEENVCPYCLKYMLGKNSDSEAADAIAAERELAVVDLSNTDLTIGPAEFVWLVRHSELVCTDSFHASAFSILFHRPFIIFERKQDGQCDMSGRFETLSRMLNIGDLRFETPSFNLDAVWDYDWIRVDALLANERERSETWLKTRLQIAINAYGRV